MRKILQVLITVAMVASVGTLAAPAQATNIGNEGCTPGYWKNHLDNWQEYSPDQTLAELFTFPESLASFRTVTLAEALSGGGGSGIDGATRILMRASVAAYLNAAHEGVGYPYRRAQLGPRIDAALASGSRAKTIALAAELDRANNLGCPLS